MSEAEEARVTLIRDRLSEGAYNVDPGRIADAILSRPLGLRVLGLERVLVPVQRAERADEFHAGSR